MAAPIKNSRQALLSLAKDSAPRYAAIRQVLGTVDRRLSNGGEATSWSPKHIIDVGSSRAEGLWAAADVWPDHLASWTGKESSTANIKVAKSLLARNGEREEPHAVHRIKDKRFETLREGAGNAGARPDEPDRTLVLSSHRLLSLPSDSHREQHVKSLWRSGAETIVLIEDGSDRGFAAIASARALLLELGEEDKQTAEAEAAIEAGQEAPLPSRQYAGREKLVLNGVEFFEERPEDRQPDSNASTANSSVTSPSRALGSWVVAPCPHDRPCPLLHPFSLTQPHEARATPTHKERSRLSHHHEAEHVGLSACVHPVRFLPPRWSTHEVVEKRRRQRDRGGREERSARIAYVVVKRGDRPTVQSLGTKEERLAAVGAARKGRMGVLDELRKGEAVPRRLPEDVVGEGEDADPLSGLAGDEEAQRELLKLLPNALKEAGASGEEGEEALRQVMAQMAALQQGNAKGEDVWAASGELGANAEQEQADEAVTTEEVDAQELNEDWLRAASSPQGNDDADSLSTALMTPTPSSSTSPYISHLLSSLPRILLPPIKKGGHVTFDACHSNGSIQRYTIAKSAGKQAYQEARKSGWGDAWSQDPVEAGLAEQDQGLETVDERTGKRTWRKRKGWGQWWRISEAAPEGLGAANSLPSASATAKTSPDGRTWVFEEETEEDDEENEIEEITAELAEDAEPLVDEPNIQQASSPSSTGADTSSIAWAADPAATSSSKSSKNRASITPTSRKASTRPSALIGADQVCPEKPFTRSSSAPGAGQGRGDERDATPYRRSRGGNRKQAKHAFRDEIRRGLMEADL
ncbi:hypothetical protein BDZ90DRAFT_273121 [Jaminaea rosea]|uniref:Uncharacterized protein n=1 Tax=Jaminaea rosea TaxID=1569628 RepID=A0A316UZZ9_9BASI|nr:hypothetical protein BDZ90DRAFT_273121 [Jaminaea rosea]PWN30802.1 hypothetical protein BDZ90DRAFT_273121 [Jaminaea rosea]